MMLYTVFTLEFCEVILVGDEEGLAHLHLATEDCVREFHVDGSWQRDDDFFAEVRMQIEEFFQRKRTDFFVKLNLQGTPFQKEVWQELAKIPYGETRSYKEIAEQMGKPNNARAVGMANSKNPVPLIIPCHRVIASNGSLAGFAHGIATKQRLLQLESPDVTFQDVSHEKEVQKQAKLDF